MAVLSLVIEQPDDTVSRLGHCLGQRFRRARFARSTAHSSLPRLAHIGRVRRTHLERRKDRSLDRYEATPAGGEAFRTWMFEPPSAMPALRGTMYGRIELCRGGSAASDQRWCARKSDQRGMYKEAARTLRKQRLKKTDPADYARRIREVLLYADRVHWSSRSERHALIAEREEEIAREAGPTVGVSSG